MSEQNSQKRGLQSEAQKTARAREGYEPIPPSSAVGGAFGDKDRTTPTDQETALNLQRSPPEEDEAGQKGRAAGN